MRVSHAVMGMPVTLEVVDRVPFEPIEQIIFDWFSYVDETYSTYKFTSIISRLNRHEVSQNQPPPEVAGVLGTCEDLRRQTGGLFDIHRGNTIDPSGYVKGWAIEQAAQLLEQQGIQNYYLEAGGDLQVKGHNQAGGLWRIGLRHPAQPDKVTKVLTLSSGAVATSGTYERGQHIYIPSSGQAATELVSLTAVGPSIARVDALGTAAFAAGLRSLAFLTRHRLEGYMITANLEAFATPHFGFYEAT